MASTLPTVTIPAEADSPPRKVRRLCRPETDEDDDEGLTDSTGASSPLVASQADSDSGFDEGATTEEEEEVSESEAEETDEVDIVAPVLAPAPVPAALLKAKKRLF